MQFHYGNCKKLIEDLEKLVAKESKNAIAMHTEALKANECLNAYVAEADRLRTQVEEEKAIFDYQVGVLEKDIENLKADIVLYQRDIKDLKSKKKNK